METSDEPIHYNAQLTPGGDLGVPVPWDNGVCGAAPEFRREDRDIAGRVHSVAVEELTNFQQTWDKSRTTCQKCKDWIAAQEAAALHASSFGWL